MIVMVGNNSSGMVHYLAGRIEERPEKYMNKLGWLLSPDAGFKEPRGWLPYAVDNGKFNCWSKNVAWNEDDYFALLDRCVLCRHKPRWILVPDEVANKEKTLWLWNQFEPRLRKYKWPLAFALQDGMTIHDVPDGAEVVFIGGSTTWKWRNVALFSASFSRVHVGRVNWFDKIEYCGRLDVESVDGTGFFRSGELGVQGQQLRDFIEGRRRYDEEPQLAPA